MSSDMSLRRRAIYTGLKPYLPADKLPAVLDHWERHYSDAPRFKLQGFVADLCRDTGMTERRGDILLSLVQAMNMSAESLMHEPAANQPPGEQERAGSGEVQAFQLLFDALLSQLDSHTAQQLRLDLLASLRRSDTPALLLEQIQSWLVEGGQLQPGRFSGAMLRALLNRAWMLITESLGPVPADRLLHRASHAVVQQDPSLEQAVARLL